AERLQRSYDRVVRLPRTRGAAGPPVNDQVLGTLRYIRIEVVHQHAHRGLLRPRTARQFRAPGRPDLAFRHRSPPNTSRCNASIVRRAGDAFGRVGGLGPGSAGGLNAPTAPGTVRSVVCVGAYPRRT